MDKKQNWFRRHWIISIFLGFIVLGMIGSIFDSEDKSDITGDVVNEQIKQTPEEVKTCTPNWNCGSWSECGTSGIQTRTCTDSNNCETNSGKPQTSQSCTYAYEEEQIEVSIDELESIFGYYSDLTEIQKEEKYETEYKNKLIKTSIVVDKIDKAALYFLTGDYVVQEMYGAPSFSQYSSRVAAFFPSSEKDKLLNANIGDTIVFTGKLTGYKSRLEFTDSKVLDIKQ